MVDRQPASQRLPFRLRFIRNQGGATAVEFAMIALPFLGLMAGIIELGLLFMGSVALDNAMQTASRRIRTGELTSPATATSAQKEANRKAFRDEICNGMGFLAADCKAKLSIDVKTAMKRSAGSSMRPLNKCHSLRISVHCIRQRATHRSAWRRKSNDELLRVKRRKDSLKRSSIAFHCRSMP